MNEFLARLLGCGTQAVYDRLEDLLNQLLPKRSLHEYGVTRQDLRDFTHSVITGQGRLMDNSFVPPGRDSCAQNLYRAVLSSGHRRATAPYTLRVSLRLELQSPAQSHTNRKTSAGGFCYAPKPERTVLVKE